MVGDALEDECFYLFGLPLYVKPSGKTIGWAFEDNGPNGGTLSKDRFWVNEKPSGCPVGDVNIDWHVLISGDITVRP